MCRYVQQITVIRVCHTPFEAFVYASLASVKMRFESWSQFVPLSGRVRCVACVRMCPHDKTVYLALTEIRKCVTMHVWSASGCVLISGKNGRESMRCS